MRERRDDFPMLLQTMHGKPLCYLDSAATALKPRCVIDAVSDYYSNSYGTVHRAVYGLAVEATNRYNGVRTEIASFIHAASEEEIIFTKGTTDAINLTAASLGKRFLQMGDVILVAEDAHHSNIVPWQLVAESVGAEVRMVPINDEGDLILESLSELLGGRTKLVAMSHISNALGTAHPVKEVCQMAHEMGALVLVDGAQGAAQRPIDVQDLEVDFYAFSGHKLYGPTGIGVLYGRKELLEEMPPYQGGGDMIRSVSFDETTYNTVPMRFEAGTPHIAGVLGLGAAIDYLQSIGMERVHAHEQHLLQVATRALEEVPRARLLGSAQDRGGIISFTVEGVHPLDLGTLLDLKGFAIRTGHHCAQPTMRRFGVEGTARLSFGLYNTEEEISRFILALQEVIEALS